VSSAVTAERVTVRAGIAFTLSKTA
jgi:hypothetical protein